MLKNILCLITVFGLSTLWIYFLYLVSGPDERLKFPTSIQDIKFLSGLLQEYSEQHFLYILILFSSVYLYKQAFAIPGSIFLNLLAGALFGPYEGFLLCCILSSVGASFCFLLSKFVTYAIVERFFTKKLLRFQDMVAKKKSRLFYTLVSLRLFPMTPNWLLNMSCPLAKVPLLPHFFCSVLLGLAPYNFLTTQAGSVLGEVESVDEIISMKVFFALSLLAIAMLGPVIMKNSVKQRN